MLLGTVEIVSDAGPEALVGLLAEESRLALGERREGFYWRTGGTFDLDEQSAD